MVLVPFDKRVGLELVESSHGQSIYELGLRADHCNPFGLTHGGVYATIMDSGMGQAAISVLKEGQSASNVDLQMQILSWSKPGDTLRCESFVTKSGKTAAFLESMVSRSDGVVCARATSVYLIKN